MYGDYNIPSLGWEPNYKLLKNENYKYNAGLLNPEYYLTSNEDEKTNFINGETYSYGAYISANMDWLTAFYQANPDAELAIAPVVGTIDETAGTTPGYRTDNPFGMMVGFSAFATEDQIKAAWMYMEWLTQEENLFPFQWGVEGETYNYDENQLPVSVSDYEGEYKLGFSNNKDYWCITIEARQAGTIEDVIRNNLPHDLPQDFTEDVIAWYNDKVQVRDAGWAIANALFSVSMEAEVEYQQSLVELYKEARDKLTMCAPEEFDTLYAQYAQEYLDAGYQEVIDERAAAWEAGNSTHMLNQTAEEVDLTK
jgi:putative aldouronate transport system substrate-binding protein